MSLTPGTRLGAYEITAHIGAGGMGEVWDATDTNLGRHVAIKVLHDSLAQDPDRLARLERGRSPTDRSSHDHTVTQNLRNLAEFRALSTVGDSVHGSRR